ncbi:BLUF domain-containing protein [Olleya marilimosa]|uniref:BLUF domain-containing protein n=1 Tax=Olleya marilimosa TaxID=272164 RepID=A0ABR8LSG2_9FLAO|nr:BLUF domain-containing protein [Olleya marilimosa]MBD3862456.1 BLUF domain-containing protein [Olleya marilimosa]MBD3889955.1 BLUF domain-containing protein [Olleya marilimosa]
MTCRRIIYSSQATQHFNKRELLDLLHDARAFNTIDNITGVLMHKDGLFVQVIEGDHDIIDDLLQRLRRDIRHSEIKIINDQTVETRLFGIWSMGCADFDDPSLSLIPGIRTDLSDPKVLEDLINRLPQVADILLENIAM